MLRYPAALDGLRARIGVLLLIHAVIIGGLFLVVILGGEKQRDMYKLPDVEEVAAIVYATERAPADLRPSIVMAANTKLRHVALIANIPAGARAVPDVDPALSGRLAAKIMVPVDERPDMRGTLTDIARIYRAALGVRPFSIQTANGAALTDYGGGRILSEGASRVIVPIEGRQSVAIEGMVLPVVGRILSTASPVLVIIVLLELVAILILANQTTRPVSKLLAAVKSDGGKTEPQWPTDGPREIRELGEAFADMRARLKRLVEQRTRIMAAVAHDFRTYLTRLELRADYIADPRQRDSAMADLEEMKVLLDDTLVFAEHTSVTTRLPDEILDLGQEIESTVATRHELGQEVLLDPLPDLLLARVARVSFQRMLANLLDNAIRYGKRARVCAKREGDWAFVYVEDEGPGVPPHRLADLTEPYHRLESSRARHTGGTGLGLTIVQALVNRHGGELILRNREGGGFVAGVRLRVA